VADRHVADAVADSFLGKLPPEVVAAPAAHLLDLASAQQVPRGRLVARVSQQELADSRPRDFGYPATRPRLLTHVAARPGCWIARFEGICSDEFADTAS
jgi:hypothetical protein